MSEFVRDLTAEQFAEEVENGKGAFLVDFWAPWCGPCRMVAPVLDELAQELKGQVNIVKVNVDDNGSIAGKYGISGIPAMLLFKDGVKVAQSVGAAPKQKIREFLTSNI